MLPNGKRIFYIDAQTYVPMYILSYDQQGELTRLSLIIHGHPDFFVGTEGTQLPVPFGATWINFSQDRASQFIARNRVFKNDDSPRRFELMELLRKGK